MLDKEHDSARATKTTVAVGSTFFVLNYNDNFNLVTGT